MQAEHQRTLPVINPRTGQVDFFLTPISEQALRTTCSRLRQGQIAWGGASLEHRIEVMLAWADQIKKNHTELAEADSIDTGYGQISQMSPAIVESNIRGWCKLAPQILKREQRSGRSSIMPHIAYQTQLRPYPLLGVISPWNAPLMLSLIDAVPALIAGCAVIIKPSEVTPRFVGPTMRTVDAIAELAGVLAYILGDGQTGQSMIQQVDMISFTGSVANGRKVAEACARRFIPACLELGGKDPVIVTAQANLDKAATAVLRGAVFGTGQVCFSVERIYVDQTVHDAFVAKLVQQAEQIALNYPDPHKGHIGPFTFQKQAKIVDDQLDDACNKGAQIRTGGKSTNLGGGFYMRPTVLTNVSHQMIIMQEETFGPVMPVMKFHTIAEAIDLANDSNYGLTAAVIAGNEAEALSIAEHIEAGGVNLQDTFLTLAKTRDIETNACKYSGLGGARTGPGAILRYLRKRAFLTNTADPEPLAAAG